MNSLSNDVYTHYLEHFEALPFDKQFHFASRLYLWHQDPQLAARLNELRPEFAANNSPKTAFAQLLALSAGSPVHGSKNASELRRPYFDKYPKLKTYVLLLFRTAFLRTIYNIDASDLLLEHFSQTELDNFAKELLKDKDAIAILSTHAINFLYLYSRVVRKDNSLFDPAFFLEIGGQAYDTRDKIHMQLLIYLYTHCIIGESMFYYRALPTSNIAVYKEMVNELERLIAANFTDINLDNKFEFLVTAKLAGQKSSLTKRIFDEAKNSISSEGTFLVDTHNNNPQAENSTLDKSEHRNVLFIMANQGFKPLGR
jgi:hypothetical protein